MEPGEGGGWVTDLAIDEKNLYLTGMYFKPGKNLSVLLCLKISPTGKCRIAGSKGL
jgi:hypothetical protein